MSTTALSRRAILAGAASVPALALPAIIAVEPAVVAPASAAPAAAAALAPDPIFAAIETHRRVWWVDCAQCSDLDAAASDGDKEAALKLDQLWVAVNDATDEVIETAPTTNAGVAALLEYVADHVVKNGTDRWPDNYSDGETFVMTLHRSVAKALRSIAQDSVLQSAAAVRS